MDILYGKTNFQVQGEVVFHTPFYADLVRHSI